MPSGKKGDDQADNSMEGDYGRYAKECSYGCSPGKGLGISF